jgi:hypothetical protein
MKIIAGTLQEERVTYLVISRSVLLRISNVLTKVVQNSKTHFKVNKFFLILPWRWTGDVQYFGAWALHAGYLRLQTHTQNM